MKKLFYIISGVSLLIALIISAVNYAYISLFWFFAEKNGSPSTAFMSMFLFGFLSGAFFVFGVKLKSDASNESDF